MRVCERAEGWNNFRSLEDPAARCANVGGAVFEGSGARSMKAKFRLVHFLPDPFTGSRIAIGALVQVGGRAKFVRAGRLPDAGCVGGRDAWAAMQMAIDSLTAAEDFGIK